MSFVISMDQPCRYPGPPPAEADAVVIGGGIAGVTAALFLARAGQRVVLCEKGRVGGEESSRNWGWVRQQGRDLAELPIMMEALGLWQEFSRRIGPELGFAQHGIAYYTRSEATLAVYDQWRKDAAAIGLDSRMLSRAEIATDMPGNGAGWIGGLVTPSDARAEPWVAVPLISGLAAGEGVTIVESCAVRALDIAGGRVTGVVTEAGQIRAPQVLLAGGAWSSLFLHRHGISLPQLAVRSSVAQTVPMPEGAMERAGVDDVFAWRRRSDGGYSLAPGADSDLFIGPDAFRHFRTYIPQMRNGLSKTGLRLVAPEKGFPDGWRTPRRWSADEASPFEAMRILDPPPNRVYLEKVRQAFGKAFPGLGVPKLKRSWAGMIDVMPDIVPVLDKAPLDGLFIATGLSGHGFGIGPGIGRVMADMMLGRPIGHDLTRFRFGRFSDGSKMVLGPTF